MEKLTKLILKHRQNYAISKNLQKGQSLVSALILTAIILILVTALLGIASNEYFFTSTSYKKTQALNLAEAGIDKAIQELKLDPNYTGSGSTPVILETGEFEVVVSGTGTSRTVEAIGYVPDKANYKYIKTVRVTLLVTSENISFHYAVQIGNEGILMYSNSKIRGNAYSNGNITGYGNSKIYGDAYAVGTISSPRPEVTGQRHEGAEPSEMPTIDYDFWRSQAAEGGTHEGDYELNSGSHEIGPLRINGNFRLNSNAVVTLKGPIYITGNFEMNSNTELHLDEDFGSSGTVIITDGTIKLNSNSYIYPTASDPKGYVLLASTNTSDQAVELNSNASNGIVFALEGGVQFNSNAKVTSVVGKKLILNSNAELKYDTGLADASFTTGPGGGWSVQTGTWQEL